jgi:FkbM family methyltransferase
LVFIEYESNLKNVGTGNDNMYSNGEFLVAQNLIKRDNVVMDIGANRGRWTKMALTLAPLKKIYCVEPISDMCREISQQFHYRPELRIVNAAVADTIKDINFFFYANSPQMAELSNIFGRPEVEIKNGLDIQTAHIKSITIDHICNIEKLEHIDFIKLDVEGAEWLAIQGMKEMLEKHAIDHIQFEYGGCFVDSKATLKEMMQYLGAYNFTVLRIFPNGLIRFENWADEMENYLHSNYLAIHNCNIPPTIFAENIDKIEVV